MSDAVDDTEADALKLRDIFDFNKNKNKRSIDMEVTKETVIGDLLDFDEGTAQFFLEIGMHCLGCPAARGESIEEACEVHGTDADELVAKINDYLATK